METIEIDGVEFSVTRSARRTVCIRVLDDGTPQILAPKRISENELRGIVLPYTERIARESEKKREAAIERAGFCLHYGDTVRCLGGFRTVCEGAARRISYDDDSFYVPAGLSGDDLKDAVIAVYKLLAKNYIAARVDELAPLLGCDVKGIRINSATSHWASCSKRDTLNFSWFCIMAEPDAIDYIIIHELCHMYEFNHSPRFWSLVARYCPSYKRHRTSLKELWNEITKENWK